jgi:hypothetical protein
VNDYDTFNLSIPPEDTNGPTTGLLHPVTVPDRTDCPLKEIPVPENSGKNGPVISLFIRTVPT